MRNFAFALAVLSLTLAVRSLSAAVVCNSAQATPDEQEEVDHAMNRSNEPSNVLEEELEKLQRYGDAASGSNRCAQAHLLARLGRTAEIDASCTRKGDEPNCSPLTIDTIVKAQAEAPIDVGPIKPKRRPVDSEKFFGLQALLHVAPLPPEGGAGAVEGSFRVLPYLYLDAGGFFAESTFGFTGGVFVGPKLFDTIRLGPELAAVVFIPHGEGPAELDSDPTTALGADLGLRVHWPFHERVAIFGSGSLMLLPVKPEGYDSWLFLTSLGVRAGIL